MSQQLICDDCGEPIDPTQPYYSLSGTKVQLTDGVLTTIEATRQLDYHDAHLPSYKVQGEIVTPTPTEPTPDEGEPAGESE